MARTKQEIENFLNSQVGKSVNTKAGRLQGQCVSLIKALFEFLGVPDPYASRGNAKDAGNTYLAQNIAERGKGELTVCINKDMGGGYGHIWLKVRDGANYEQNGAKALTTTKNTRPTSQGQQFVNLDKWIEESDTIDDMITESQLNVLSRFYRGKSPTEDDKKKYVGKWTWKKVQDYFLTTDAYKKDVAEAKAGTLSAKEAVAHLPAGIRKVYKG